MVRTTRKLALAALGLILGMSVLAVGAIAGKRLRVFVGGKMGFMDAKGGILVRARFDYVDPDFEQGLARFRIGDKFGYIDERGAVAIPAIFEGAADFHKGTALVISGGKFGLIDPRGRWIHGPRFDSIAMFDDRDIVQVEIDGKMGLVHRDGSIIAPCAYSYVGYGYFNDGIARLESYGGPEGEMPIFIDESGHVRCAPSFTKIGDYSGGLAIVEQDGKYGYIDANGNLVGAIAYDKAYPAKEGMGRVSAGGKYGFVGSRGEGAAIVAPRYADASDFSGGLAAVKTSELYGYIDTNGRSAIPERYRDARPFKKGAAWVREALSDSRYGLIDAKGAWLVPPTYDGVESEGTSLDACWVSRVGGTKVFSIYEQGGRLVFEAEGLAIGMEGDFVEIADASGSYGYYSAKDGELLWTGSRISIERKYQLGDAAYFSYKDLSTTLPERKGRLGLLDGSLRELIAPKAYSVWGQDECLILDMPDSRAVVVPFEDGLAELPAGIRYVESFSDSLYKAYGDGEMFSFIRKSDLSLVSEELFSRAWPLSEGLAVVARLDDYEWYLQDKYHGYRGVGKFGYVNEDGEIAIPLTYDCAYEFSEGLAVVREGDYESGKRGYIDATGAYVLEPAYDFAYSFDDGIACIVVADKVGYIDRAGKYIFRPSL